MPVYPDVVCRMNIHESADTLHWFALSVYGNKVFAADEKLKSMGLETYIPVTTHYIEGKNGKPLAKKVPAVSRLMFVRTTKRRVLEVEKEVDMAVHVYRTLDTDVNKRKPIVIPNAQMHMFILISSSGETGLEYFPSEKLTFKSGSKVRVIYGPLAGSVGHIKRIKGNRRFVVEVKGVCAIATSYIPAQFLEKLQDDDMMDSTQKD